MGRNYNVKSISIYIIIGFFFFFVSFFYFSVVGIEEEQTQHALRPAPFWIAFGAFIIIYPLLLLVNERVFMCSGRSFAALRLPNKLLYNMLLTF